ncbi:hypothetical protein [Mediterraneibacter glycyrrhizinilyticus]|uniref:hypothetical protein n=1 Tax=Mediterraneibacter glycyrrhizinilyticus TaxID=342942 RepID=UPI0025A343DF|nr:hypothetical protein [Mediterraneibacter glycyrrhizinilyticus]MDM8123992.1 hypothetical protein [Mediterraneibacter glycyrrhizinilyticus]
MRKAKKRPMVVQAYRLGEENDVLAGLTAEGEICLKGDGSFEVFSQETKGDSGEIAYTGDYIKLDSSGNPYPNSAEYFEKNHCHIAGAFYEQRSKTVLVWMYGDSMCPEISYLIEQKHLTFHEDDPDKYFRAPLWGTELSAPKDAVIVIYRISRDESGKITDADFNFVAGTEFDKTYELLPEDKD